MTDFHVKVTRYTRFDNGSEVWDGCFYSKVYAIDTERDLFLVYDDGDGSAYDEEGPRGFMWVCFTNVMPDQSNDELMQPVVELVTKVITSDYYGDEKVIYKKGEWL